MDADSGLYRVYAQHDRWTRIVTDLIKDSQFTLLPDGQVGFQPDPTNPLPGAPCARLEKGERPLHPRLSLLPGREGPEGLEQRAGQWLETRIATVLEPLVLLEKAAGLSAALQALADALLSGFGAVARADVPGPLKDLTAEDRQILRARKIRSGSLHVYFQDLNKPAAVKLRAFLWALWHDTPVPPPLPHDGAVSALCPPDAPEPFGQAYWLAIGYPRCARRLVRIDMLDRLVGAVYDGARKGVFRATHQMAEWLGVPIETLYDILEALGHRKIEEPELVAPNPTPASAAEATEVVRETDSESSAPPPAPSPEESLSALPAAPPEGAVESGSGLNQSVSLPAMAPSSSGELKKPELALFRLARMHAPTNRPSGPPRRQGHGSQADSSAQAPQTRNPDSPDGPRGPHKGKHHGRHGQEDSHDSRSTKGARSDKPRDREEGKKRSFDRPPRPRHGADDLSARAERPERVIRAEAKVNPDDSPFAVLRQLMKPQTPDREPDSDPKASEGG